ncbi:MAG: NAD-dependent epimerase/dehydratase family protein [Ferruginibacter sp.]
MKILVTGATGYIGNHLAHTLACMGHQVHALVRSSSSKELLQHQNISIFKGDILDKESLLNAMQGCRQVYHTAAKVGVWAKDLSVFYKVNIEGTLNVLNTALQTGVERSVVTSTCGVIGPSLNEPMSENDPRINGFAIDYELSKKMSEDIVLEYAKKGMNVVLVCPSKVYGPGNVSHTLTTNAIIDKFLKKGIAFIPAPGTYKACFAYIDDIIKGHLLAMEKGNSGEKYILGGFNITYREFFDRIRNISCSVGHIVQLPANIIKGWALLQQLNYKITGTPPYFTIKSTDIFFSNYTFSSDKASRELGYTITPLEDALKKTIQFLNTIHHA